MTLHILAFVAILLMMTLTKTILSERTIDFPIRIIVAIAVDAIIYFCFIIMLEQITIYNNLLDLSKNLK